MKVKSAIQALSTSTLASSNKKAAIPTAWVEAIFTRLHAQFGAKIADLYAGVPTDVVKEEWAQALAHFKPEEISRGLKSCQSRVFPPTLGEFLRLCRPALDPEVAWMEAVAGMQQRSLGHVGNWSHPAVYRTAREFQHELLTANYRQHRHVWQMRLEKEFEAGWQDDVQKPAQTLTHQPTTRRPSVADREGMAALRAQIVASRSRSL